MQARANEVMSASYCVCYSWTEFPAGEVIKCLTGLGIMERVILLRNLPVEASLG